MDQIAVVTGADRGLGLALTAGLLQKQWRVFAGQYMPDWPELSELASRYPTHLTLVPLDVSSNSSVQDAAQACSRDANQVDLLINNAGVNLRSTKQSIREGLDYDDIHQMHNINAVGPLRVVESFLPLLEKSEMKRLCFVSSEAGSIGDATRQAQFGYCMSKSALNMAVKILFNDLRKEGFTFRLYHPGWMRSYISGQKGTSARMEPEEAAVQAMKYFLQNPSDTATEDRLVLRDWRDRELPW